jgi:hypothetical protein
MSPAHRGRQVEELLLQRLAVRLDELRRTERLRAIEGPAERDLAAELGLALVDPGVVDV